jgi:hypothetical protein
MFLLYNESFMPLQRDGMQDSGHFPCIAQDKSGLSIVLK